MICKECGKNLSEYSTKCSYCGTPQPNAKEKPVSVENNSKKKLIRILLAGALCLAVLGIIIYILFLK